jgi:type I restriction enzyme S subunit
VFNEDLYYDENDSLISEADYIEIVRNGYPAAGDILLSCVGSIGRCCIFPKGLKAAFQRSVAFIRCSAKYNNEFMKYLVQSSNIQSQLHQSANASAQGGVYLGAIQKIRVNAPTDYDEQVKIATILSDMDAEIDVLKAKLNKAKLIKQGMMEQLLTGKIRLAETGTASVANELFSQEVTGNA